MKIPPSHPRRERHGRSLLAPFVFLLLVGATLASLATAQSSSDVADEESWSFFRTRNDAVTDGNERMVDGDYVGALAAYDRAAGELPNEPRVQLNRGLALLAAGTYPEAREALLRAVDPDAPGDIRAAAYYNLGLAFFQEGDAAATSEDHQAAQAAFREAADSFRRSLRAKPGNREAAWNLELALRRIREEEERQEQQDQDQQQDQQNQQNQDQQPQDPQNQDQQQPQGEQNPDPQGDQNTDPQNQDQPQDPQGDDPQGEDPQQGEDQQQDSQNDDGQEPQDPGDDGQEADEPDPSQGEQSGDGSGTGAEEQTGETGAGQRLPGHVERVLDALEDDEESLQRARARARAARDNRRVTMDW